MNLEYKAPSPGSAPPPMGSMMALVPQRSGRCGTHPLGCPGKMGCSWRAVSLRGTLGPEGLPWSPSLALEPADGHATTWAPRRCEHTAVGAPNAIKHSRASGTWNIRQWFKVRPLSTELTARHQDRRGAQLATRRNKVKVRREDALARGAYGAQCCLLCSFTLFRILPSRDDEPARFHRQGTRGKRMRGSHILAAPRMATRGPPNTRHLQPWVCLRETRQWPSPGKHVHTCPRQQHSVTKGEQPTCPPQMTDEPEEPVLGREGHDPDHLAQPREGTSVSGAGNDPDRSLQPGSPQRHHGPVKGHTLHWVSGPRGTRRARACAADPLTSQGHGPSFL